MELSSEDSLRLNVLLANQPQAIRIDESSMTLYGLSAKGEAKVKLNPTGRDEHYLRAVRELLSGHVLGSPGGYPIYLQRWTRMGQTRDENLENLLLLGEPEAVVAVTGATGLTDELARRAWWTLQDPDNARRMLQHNAVRAGAMGPELAQFLIEYLPFESEPEIIVESLRLALQPGLVDEATRDKLWARCNRKPTYYLGFLASTPNDLPEAVAPRTMAQSEEAALKALVDSKNPYAACLLGICEASGQAFLKTVGRVMEKPANQDVVTLLLDVVRDYLAEIRPSGDPDLELESLRAEAEHLLQVPAADTALEECLAAAPGMAEDLKALIILSGLGYGVVRPIFRKTAAIGSLMRKKLAPVSEVIVSLLRQLQGKFPAQ
jgi:hypothetical protein